MDSIGVNYADRRIESRVQRPASGVCSRYKYELGFTCTYEDDFATEVTRHCLATVTEARTITPPRAFPARV